MSFICSEQALTFMQLYYLLMLFCFFNSAAASAESCVILLHGLARTSDSMDKMQTELTEAGYKVVNHDYPSRERDILSLAASEISQAMQKCTDYKKMTAK